MLTLNQKAMGKSEVSNFVNLASSDAQRLEFVSCPLFFTVPFAKVGLPKLDTGYLANP